MAKEKKSKKSKKQKQKKQQQDPPSSTQEEPAWNQHPVTTDALAPNLVAGAAFLDTIPEDKSVAAARIANLSTASAVASSDDEEENRAALSPTAGGSAASDVQAELGGADPSSQSHHQQPAQSKPFCTKQKWIFYTIVVVMMIAVAVGVYFIVIESKNRKDENLQSEENTTAAPSPANRISGTGAPGTDGGTFPPVDFDFFVESESPSSAPSLNFQNRFSVDQALLQVSFEVNAAGENMIYDTTTPQGTCRNWMISQDLIPSVVGDARIQQRYILCVLYHSTNNPNNPSLWSMDSSAHECDWNGISCGGGQIRIITLAEFNLIGTMPNEIAFLPNLQALSLFGNSLAGNIPAAVLWSMPNLVWCDLSANMFSGTINLNPSVTSNIQVLLLYDNQLQGTVPLMQFPNLERLWIQNNQFSSFPSTLTNQASFPQLTSLVLYGNEFSGPLLSPSVYWPAVLPNLQDLDIAENLWTGNIPDSIWELPNLRTLVAHDCLFSGPIVSNGESPLISKSLEHVWLYGNQLSGDIPPLLGWDWSNLTSYLLFENPQLTGTIGSSLCSRWPLLERLETDCGINCACCTDCGGRSA